MIARGFGAAATLIVLVLALFALARVLGGRPAGQLSPRQRRARAAQSARDVERMARPVAASPVSLIPSEERPS